ncbi:MAG: hypothetical protein K0Q97_775 [Bacillota bacterium]|jgi:two-component system sensor histidine kinase YcbA|nr:hypothetical protein [Bacillota bacterium]
MVITALGELYFYPLSENFRFSAGVVAFNIVLLLVDDFNEIKLSIYTGFSVLVLRFLIENFASDYNMLDIFISKLPSFVYYLLYGIAAYIISFRKNRENLLRTILSLFSIDVLCNLTEAIIRQDLNSDLFKFIVLIGFIRSIVSFGIYIIVESQKNIIRKKEHQKRYIQLNTLVSNIQAELFYLKKSTQDIESVMSMSYSLYESTKENENINQDALNIAREVHEIKKDYYRVLNGFESFLKEFETNESMSFKDIAFIIEGNSKRYIEERMKDIDFSIAINNNIYIKKYYSVFTILNNLITNAIDAIKKSGYIKIVQYTDDDNIVFTVSDSGGGIDEQLIPYIFNPGFTTKFDDKTGVSSTGIGLSHVKNIVDELQGDIKVTSNKKGTEFKVYIPLKYLKIQ